MLVMAVVALSVPSLFNHTLGGEALPINTLESISIGVAVVMIGLYALGLVYSLRNGPAHAAEHAAPAPAGGAVAPITSGEGATALTPPGVPAAVHWSPRTAMVVLAIATAAVVWLSEILVHQVEAVTEALHLSEFFLGIILIPIIGNVAEHLVAVEVAMKNHMDLSLEIALGSSLQIALFVAPVLVFVSLLFGQYLNLVFNQFELLALIGAVVISALVASDGETNWLEGAQLLAVYLILGVAFYFLPA
jgi:Ca2+:H+ antiporter